MSDEESSKEIKRINAVFPIEMYEKMEKAVKQGLAGSIPEFLRQCVSMRLDKLIFTEPEIQKIIDNNEKTIIVLEKLLKELRQTSF